MTARGVGVDGGAVVMAGLGDDGDLVAVAGGFAMPDDFLEAPAGRESALRP
jgi:hypothetical protein